MRDLLVQQITRDAGMIRCRKRERGGRCRKSAPCFCPARVLARTPGRPTTADREPQKKPTPLPIPLGEGLTPLCVCDALRVENRHLSAVGGACDVA